MFKKLRKGYRNQVNSRLKNYGQNFNHHIHHGRGSNQNEVNTYYFAAFLSKANKTFIRAYSSRRSIT